ncbi:MAG TPA: PorP/SprF family type IX secretion system membrane protein [Bacteroidia bacterium]|nr:PorP/SprF family type IX secretion system membrane protein [Bacteroidia bacterium]
MKKRTMAPFLILSKVALLAVILWSIPSSGLSQDTHFSQFYMSPLTQNPALTGALYDMEAYLNYRNQWQSVTTPYQTMAASFDMRISKKSQKKGFWAAGMNMYSDKAGDAHISTNQVNLSLAYHVRLNDFNTLGAGLQCGFAQRGLDAWDIRTGSQFNGVAYDPTLPTAEGLKGTTLNYFDTGAGLIWTYNNNSGAIKVTDNHELKFNVGVSILHPNQPGYSFYDDGEKLYMKYVIHGSALLSIPNTNIAFVPSFFYCVQGPLQEIYVGTLIRYKLKQDSKYTGRNKGAALSLGSFYRAGDSAIAALLLEYSGYAIGFSYDINNSSLQSASHYKGGMEITLRFVNPNPFTN